MTYRVPVVYKDGKHEPMNTGVDQIDSTAIPVAPLTGNRVRVVQKGNDKGLFVGSGGSEPVLYVSSTGTDAPTNGSKASPLKTVDYALQLTAAQYGGQVVSLEGRNIPEMGVLPVDVVIAMKAGEVFSLNASYQFTGRIVLTFYGDVNYGDFDGPVINGKAFPATMQDLARPTLNLQVEGSTTGVTHFKGVDNLVGSAPATLTLLGITVNLPDAPASNTDYQDLLYCPAEHTVRLQLIGARVNKLGTGNQFGCVGIQSRGRAIIEQYASQYLVQGQQVQSGAANDALLARQAFIKFYPDRLGNSQLGGTLNTGYAPTGMLELQWTNCNAELVQPGKVSQATYPQQGDPSFGIAAYFTNLLRDPQARPFNVICPALL